jgi:hypothetical protein
MIEGTLNRSQVYAAYHSVPYEGDNLISLHRTLEGAWDACKESEHLIGLESTYNFVYDISKWAWSDEWNAWQYSLPNYTMFEIKLILILK